MFPVEEFGKTHDGIQRCTDFVTHVCEEGLFQHLNLTGFLRLASQLLLGGLDFADVTNESEILGDTLVVDDWHEREIQMEATALLGGDQRLDGILHGGTHAVVHAVHQSLGGFLRLVGSQCQQACLRQTKLHMVDLAIDGQRMVVRGIGGNTHATVLHDVIDVTDILLQLGISLLHLDDVLLQTGVRLRQFGDVTTCAVDGQQASIVVANGHQLQFVV